jgi:hypothetical protein
MAGVYNYSQFCFVVFKKSFYQRTPKYTIKEKNHYEIHVSLVVLHVYLTSSSTEV